MIIIIKIQTNIYVQNQPTICRHFVSLGCYLFLGEVEVDVNIT